MTDQELDTWLARHLDIPARPYSTDIAAAWRLIDWLQGRRIFYRIGMHHLNSHEDQHVCDLWSVDRARYECSARSDIAPRAISLAVYEWAKGIEP